MACVPRFFIFPVPNPQMTEMQPHPLVGGSFGYAAGAGWVQVLNHQFDQVLGVLQLGITVLRKNLPTKVQKWWRKAAVFDVVFFFSTPTPQRFPALSLNEARGRICRICQAAPIRRLREVF